MEAPERSPVETWLSDVPPVDGGMLWCHTLSGWDFQTVAGQDSCSTTFCDVFGQKLFYLYYGRAAFRIKNEPLVKGGAAPFALLFKPAIANRRARSGNRMFPFDTGAWEPRYIGWMAEQFKLDHYRMTCNDESPRKHVRAFFQSNQRYAQAAPAEEPYKDVAYPFQIHSLYHMYQGNRPLGEESMDLGADDRRLTIELQLDDEVPFDSGLLCAVIHPKGLEKSELITNFQRKHPPSEVIYRPYKVDWKGMAEAMHPEIEKAAIEIQQEMGLL